MYLYLAVVGFSMLCHECFPPKALDKDRFRQRILSLCERTKGRPDHTPGYKGQQGGAQYGGY